MSLEWFIDELELGDKGRLWVPDVHISGEEKNRKAILLLESPHSNETQPKNPNGPQPAQGQAGRYLKLIFGEETKTQGTNWHPIVDESGIEIWNSVQIPLQLSPYKEKLPKRTWEAEEEKSLQALRARFGRHNSLEAYKEEPIKSATEKIISLLQGRLTNALKKGQPITIVPLGNIACNLVTMATGPGQLKQVNILKCQCGRPYPHPSWGGYGTMAKEQLECSYAHLRDRLRKITKD